MNRDFIISVDGVSVVFNLAAERTDTLKEYLIKIVKRELMFQEFYALKNVSLNIERGDSVALVGVNGSGKSTMLKVIAGVLYPSTGRVSVKGSVAPLIELGAGFDMDLTARENIYLNGAVLGYDRKYMNDHFNRIVEFAELWDFVDVPVKNFSSGMIARLGFAIATEVTADILIVDEVLSVGDIRFQEKCRNRIQELLKGGTTLLFVSHSIDLAKKMCRKAVWIDKGVLKGIGTAEEICNAYLASVS